MTVNTIFRNAMYPLLSSCPVCRSELEVTHLYCRSCDTTLSGHFTPGRFAHLTAEQLDFIELFVRCEGKINRVGQELNLSYPAVRARLTELIEALGYSVGESETPATLSESQRKDILAQVYAGQLSAEEAAELLRG